MKNIIQSYEVAKETYLQYGIDGGQAMEACDRIPLSIHCWQCADGIGLEGTGSALSGGIQVTGNHFGKAYNFEEIAADLDWAFSYVPGCKKVNVNAIYLGNLQQFVDRNQIKAKHFDQWIDWANQRDFGINNGMFYSHPLSADGYTLSHRDNEIKIFWIDHGERVRNVSAYIAQRTGKQVVNNIWIPDGEKEDPVDT